MKKLILLFIGVFLFADIWSYRDKCSKGSFYYCKVYLKSSLLQNRYIDDIVYDIPSFLRKNKEMLYLLSKYYYYFYDFSKLKPIKYTHIDYTFKFSKYLCDNLDFRGCLVLGDMYRYGDGVGKNPTLANNYYKKAYSLAKLQGVEVSDYMPFYKGKVDLKYKKIKSLMKKIYFYEFKSPSTSGIALKGAIDVGNYFFVWGSVGSRDFIGKLRGKSLEKSFFKLEGDKLYFSKFIKDKGFVGVGYKHVPVYGRGGREGFIGRFDKNLRLKRYFKFSSKRGYLVVKPLYDLAKLKDGYIAVGSDYFEGVIAKFNKNFKLVWEKNIKKGGKYRFTNVVALKDGYLIFGNYNNSNIYYAKFDKKGNIISQNIIEGENYSNKVEAIAKVKDGYLFASKVDGDIVLTKIDKNAKKIWQKYTSLKQLGVIIPYKNGYLLGGAKRVLDEYDDIWIGFFKDGKIKWEYTKSIPFYARVKYMKIKDNKLIVLGTDERGAMGYGIYTYDRIFVLKIPMEFIKEYVEKDYF